MLGPVLLRRRCPAVPRFDGPALLRDGSLNDHAEHMSIYFRPWTLCLADANDDVSHVANLCGSGSWRAAWRKWVHGGVLSDRLARYVTNFQAVHSLCEQDDGTVDNHGRCDTQQQHRFSGSPHMYMLSVLTQGAHQTVQSATAARIPAPGRPATTSTGLGLRLMVLRGSEKTRLGISHSINAWHRGHVNRNAARSVKSSCQTPAYCHLCRHFYHSKN